MCFLISEVTMPTHCTSKRYTHKTFKYYALNPEPWNPPAATPIIATRAGTTPRGEANRALSTRGAVFAPLLGTRVFKSIRTLHPARLERREESRIDGTPSSPCGGNRPSGRRARDLLSLSRRSLSLASLSRLSLSPLFLSPLSLSPRSLPPLSLASPS